MKTSNYIYIIIVLLAVTAVVWLLSLQFGSENMDAVEGLVEDVVEDGTNSNDGIEEDTSDVIEFESGIRGQVLLGPQCPAVREGEECPDKAYATIINIYREERLYLSTESGDEGFYQASLPPGEYRIEPVGKEPFPTCESETATVLPEKFTQLTLRCDTGIR